MANADWGTAGVTRSDNVGILSITGAAYADYSSNGSTSYIPILFAKKMLRLFYAESHYQEICSTEYQGQISKMGDQVIIRVAPDMTINDYEVGSILTYEVPTSSEVTLDINKGKYWGYQIQDVDALQSDLNLVNEFASNAASKLAVAIDAEVLTYFTTAGHTSNRGVAGTGLAGAISGTIPLGSNTVPTEITTGATSNAVTHIVNCNLALDEQNVPDNDRWIIVPSWFCAYLKTSDLKAANVTGDTTGVIRTGVLGMIDRTKVIRSNNIPAGAATGGPGAAGNYWTLFGTKEACTFAMQLTKSESLRIPTSFGEYHRGLAIYGREAVQPKALGAGVITQ